MIRLSTEDDENIIRELIDLCFGVRAHSHIFNDLNGRYYLYFEKDKLVAMSGINRTTDCCDKLEVDWTCTHPDYQGQGYMQKLFRVMLTDIDPNEDIYCSCWHWFNRDQINLKSVMKAFRFKLILEPRIHYKVPHNCRARQASDCKGWQGESCECYEDLYLRKGGSVS